MYRQNSVCCNVICFICQTGFGGIRIYVAGTWTLLLFEERLLRVNQNKKIMKKLFLILLTSMALAACGDGSNRSEANRDETDNMETNEPAVGVDDDANDMQDTTSTNMQTDTTSTGAGARTTPAP